jgi:hypothetical protein
MRRGKAHRFSDRDGSYRSWNRPLARDGRLCKQTYPAGTFSVEDLREVARLGSESFDAVIATYGVLDVLGDGGC